MNWARARDLLAHPLDTSLPRFVAWVILSGLGMALIMQLLTHAWWASLVGIPLLYCATLVVESPDERNRSIPCAAAGGVLLAIFVAMVVGAILGNEKRLGFLEPNTARPPSPGTVPVWGTVAGMSAWVGVVAFETWRFYASRRRHAA